LCRDNADALPIELIVRTRLSRMPDFYTARLPAKALLDLRFLEIYPDMTVEKGLYF